MKSILQTNRINHVGLSQNSRKKVLGILGGMGPLASAEFIKTIYEFNIGALEQESPVCILYSDPTFPDRTEAILNNSYDLLITLLIEKLENLFQLGASKAVISCITMHCFLPKLPLYLREKIISLIDLVIQEVLERKKPCLLLCTNGTRKTESFQKNELWYLAESYILLPNDEEQNIIHKLIYTLKNNGNQDSAIDYINMLTQKYNIDCWIAGCTELHLLQKYLTNFQIQSLTNKIIDPLTIISKKFHQVMN